MMKKGTLIAEEYPNGIILPQKQSDNGPRWGAGGVCNAENTFVQTSFYNGGWATHGGYYDWKEEIYIDEDVVYIGMYTAHWGHFLIDMTNRLWFLHKLSQFNLDFKVAYLGDEIPAGNNLSVFKILGIKEEQLINITEPTRFRKVYVPQQSFKSCEWYTTEFVDMLDLICDKVLKSNYDFSRVKDIEKIYFTRKNFGKAQNSEFGESFFENCFLKNEYTAVSPEKLSLEEQIYLWNHASEIACINGTIPLNVMFSKNENLKLVVLNKTSIPHENPLILLKMRKIDAQFIDIYNEPLKSYPKSLGEGPFLLWFTPAFQDFCSKNELLLPLDAGDIKKYFFIQKCKYFWAVLGIKRKLRRLIVRLFPNKWKLEIKEQLQRFNRQ